MKAIILSAGYGKRLNPLTLKQPKPLLKIGNDTLLSNTIKFLKKFGVEEVIINVHYLADQIINYLKENKFDLPITTIKEEDRILDTGGGVLNAISFFSNKPFIIINPDTIWKDEYLNELMLMEKMFSSNEKCKCSMLLVNKKKSFDKNIKGDFNLTNNIINRDKNLNLKYIYTGLQIIKPGVFMNLKIEPFSINKIWDNLIKKNELYGMDCNIDFLHISTLDIYRNLQKKFFKY